MDKEATVHLPHTSFHAQGVIRPSSTFSPPSFAKMSFIHCQLQAMLDRRFLTRRVASRLKKVQKKVEPSVPPLMIHDLNEGEEVVDNQPILSTQSEELWLENVPGMSLDQDPDFGVRGNITGEHLQEPFDVAPLAVRLPAFKEEEFFEEDMVDVDITLIVRKIWLNRVEAASEEFKEERMGPKRA
ncbi:hypothetical protein AMTR_s00050p00190740 [Amborella trichopoda]|uniref:Uncharacterized protein n=1 Tax=Amborella trichopoda TaxID=13333 RepID=W1PY90_AMBTC|nr:hypothetical protein AMTR_s00050p00190740 [Amborella trichopoda]